MSANINVATSSLTPLSKLANCLCYDLYMNPQPGDNHEPELENHPINSVAPPQFITGSHLEAENAAHEQNFTHRLLLILPVILVIGVVAFSILYSAAGSKFGGLNVVLVLPLIGALVLIALTLIRWSKGRANGKSFKTPAIILIIIIFLPFLFNAYADWERANRNTKYIHQMASDIDYSVFMPGGNDHLNGYSFSLLRDDLPYAQVINSFGAHYFVEGRKDYGIQLLANARAAVRSENKVDSIKILNKNYIPAVYKNCAPSQDNNKIEELKDYCIDRGSTPKGRQVFSYDDTSKHTTIYYFDVGNSRIIVRQSYPSHKYLNCDDTKKYIESDGIARTCKESNFYQQEAEKMYDYVDSFAPADLKLMSTDTGDSAGVVKFIE